MTWNTTAILLHICGSRTLFPQRANNNLPHRRRNKQFRWERRCCSRVAEDDRTYAACARVPHTPPSRVGGLNLPHDVALVTTRSAQTPSSLPSTASAVFIQRSR